MKQGITDMHERTCGLKNFVGRNTEQGTTGMTGPTFSSKSSCGSKPLYSAKAQSLKISCFVSQLQTGPGVPWGMAFLRAKYI